MMCENADAFFAHVVAAMARASGIAIVYERGRPWTEVQRLIEAGRADIGFMCGLPYVVQADASTPRYTLLAAPILRAPICNGRPVYFSEMVVRADSPFNTFDDLRGATIAYNGKDSHSGYNVLRAHLAQRGDGAFFSRAVASEAHLNSLRMVADGEVDAAAVDITVLDFERARGDRVLDWMRSIATLGPSPAPPAVILRECPHIDELRRAILAVGCDGWPIMGFAAVTDADYDPIRQMALQGSGVKLDS